MSDHFTLEELCRSSRADAEGIENAPSAAVARRLGLLCLHVLEPMREGLGAPLSVTSGYRCESLNALVGGKPSSQHVRGEAADVVPEGADLRTAFDAVYRSGIPYDQLILEPGWIHVSVCPDREPRRQALWAERTPNGMQYHAYAPEG